MKNKKPNLKGNRKIFLSNSVQSTPYGLNYKSLGSLIYGKEKND